MVATRNLPLQAVESSPKTSTQAAQDAACFCGHLLTFTGAHFPECPQATADDIECSDYLREPLDVRGLLTVGGAIAGSWMITILCAFGVRDLLRLWWR